MATKTARKSLIPGLSRKEIAGELGVSWRTVERWEQTGKVPPWLPKAIKLFLILNPKYSNLPPKV